MTTVDQDKLDDYASILQSVHPEASFALDGWSAGDSFELLCKGIVVTLESLASPHAIEILYTTAVDHPNPAVSAQALLSLERLASGGSRHATDDLFRLAIETNRMAARQVIEANHWQPSRPGLRALYDFLFADPSSAPDSDLALLARAYSEEASPSLRERILALAGSKGFENWATVITMEEALMSHAPSKSGSRQLDVLIDQYPAYSQSERTLTLNSLARIAVSGPEDSREVAQSALARLFVEHEDPQARQIALENGYLPVDPEKRALFFFLANAWDEYEALDFDHRLLVSAFEYGSKGLRLRLLEHSRRSGYMEWLRGSSSSGEIRWPRDLTDADWELAVRRLGETERWSEMWQLAQVAPMLWSAQIIDRLANAGWLPPEEDDRPAFAALRSLVRECLATPLTIRPARSVTAPSPLNCLAIHPQSNLIAAGGTDQQIFCWNLPSLLLRHPTLSGPIAVTRALTFSPDGSMIAAAAGDHRIRVFRLVDGALVKTLEGHRALVRSLAVHPDGRSLASAGFDGSIRLWRFPYGPEVRILKPPTAQDEIFSLTISPDGRSLLTAGADRKVSVWSLPDGVFLRQLEGHSGTITNLSTSLEGDLVASAGRDGEVRIWNYNSGRLVKAIPFPSASITALCLHPEDQVLFGASTGQGSKLQPEILAWNISTGLLIDRLAGHNQPITGLVVTSTGDSLFSCDASGRLNSWDLRAFLLVRLAAHPHSSDTSIPAVRLLTGELIARLSEPGISPAEKKWLAFTIELTRFRQRHDIELAEFQKIPLGEFDIEL